ncbi:unnamed protein product [Prorocentrum cordatum]|uniref:Uncharacterized protein n=1 Tax=Prorocentrum cordatum TaxID=2364126 RepID=A0ABN9VBT4_9DINO|nr:unnamed protein product [Polarella glacialis]
MITILGALTCLAWPWLPRRTGPALPDNDMQSLKDELERMRELMRASGMAAGGDHGEGGPDGETEGMAAAVPFGIPGGAPAHPPALGASGTVASGYAPAGASALGDLAGWAGTPGTAGGGEAVHRPTEVGATSKAGASLVKDYLMTTSATAHADPYWATKFWDSVARLEQGGRLDVSVVHLLRGHGYVGAGAVTVPRVADLARGLEALASSAAPALGGAAGRPLGLGGLATAGGGSQETRWGASLPPDMQRAGAEIYRAMGAEGCTSTRDWLSARCGGSRASPAWTDLWTLASTVDFAVRDCKTEDDLMKFLSTNDLMEISLRRLAAYMYESRSGDRTGALHMLGVSPPGSQTDVAPSWLVQSATAHSRAEHQRNERVAADLRRRGGKGDKGEKDKTKKAATSRGSECGRWVQRQVLDETHGLRELLHAAPGAKLYPIPLVEAPGRPNSTSNRLRQRFHKKFALMTSANEYLSALNAMHRGDCRELTRGSRDHDRLKEMLPHHQRIQRLALRGAARLREARRGCGLTGAQAIEKLVKSAALSYTGAQRRKTAHETLRADAVDEPLDPRVAPMLSALSPEEAAFYSEEAQVVAAPEARSQAIFRELEQQYGFAGGSEEKYARYFLRQDIAPNLWKFGFREDVRAIAGFSVVPKKDPAKQRKIIMMVASNYMFQDVRPREEHELHGGAALASVHVPSDFVSASAFDESNAFTSVEVPEWMWAVYILMTINMTSVGRTLVRSCGLWRGCSEEDFDVNEEGQFLGKNDEDWAQESKVKKSEDVGKGFTVDGWVQKVLEVKTSGKDVVVVMHLFAGPRRPGDLEEWLHVLGASHGLEILVLSCDLELDPNWDLTIPETFQKLWGLDPYPSVYSTEVMCAMEERTTAVRVSLDQCMYGGLARKATALSGTDHIGSRASNISMHRAADDLVELGLKVTDRRESDEVDKVVGYEIQQHPARLRLPAPKAAALYEAMLYLERRTWVSLDAVSSLLGVWVWAALLARHWLAAPQHIFQFAKQNEGFPGRRGLRRWWPSALREWRVMRCGIMGLHVDLGAPISEVVLATDAEGSNGLDCGGYGFVATATSDNEARLLWEAGTRPGYALARLGQEKRVLEKAPRSLHPNLPVSSVPKEIWDTARSWIPVAAGRWRWGEHIAVGEMRAVVLALERLVQVLSFYRSSDIFRGRPAGQDDPEVIDVHEEGRVSNSTILKYKEAVVPLIKWCVKEAVEPFTPDQWDDAIMDFKRFGGSEAVGMGVQTKSKFTLLLAAVEFRFPRMEGRLCRVRAALKGWDYAHQPRHTAPMISNVRAWMCIHFCARGVPRLGFGIVIQGKFGMRPSEMLGVEADDITLPEDWGYPGGSGPVVIGLGIRAMTKAKRPQSVSFQEELEPGLAYRTLIKTVQASFNLDVGWGPHSPRAEFASESTALGIPFETIREMGRWGVDSSLRIYIDVVQASQVGTALRAAGLQPALDWAARYWYPTFRQAFDGWAALRKGAAAQAKGEGVESGSEVGSWLDVGSPGASSARAPATPMQNRADTPPPRTPGGLGMGGAYYPPVPPWGATTPPPFPEVPPLPPATPKVSAKMQAAAGKPLAKSLSAGKGDQLQWVMKCVPSGPLLGKLVLAAMLLRILPASLFPNAARGLIVMTDVAEEVGSAAGRIVTAGANVSTSAAKLVSAVTDGSIGLVEAAWRGVDLLDVQVLGSTGRFSVEDENDWPAFLQEPEVQQALQLEPEFSDELERLLLYSSATRPRGEFTHSAFRSPKSYQSVSFWVRWLPSGHVGIAWRVVTIRFRPQWANPVWGLLGMDETAEAPAMAEQLKVLADSSFPAPELDLGPEMLRGTPALPGGSTRRLVRRVRRAVARVLQFLFPFSRREQPRLLEPDRTANTGDGWHWPGFGWRGAARGCGWW